MPDTIESVIERLYRQYLEPPTYQPIRAWTTQAVATTTTDTITIGSFGVPEDRELLRVGIILEVGSELMLIRQSTNPLFDPIVLTVERGQYGTTRTTHGLGAQVKLHPLFPRRTSFEAIRDNIISLHPKLFTVRTFHASPVESGVYACNDELAISIERARPFNGQYGSLDIRGEVVDHHPATDGRAFQFPVMVGDMWITYRRRMAVATDEADSLEDLGVEDVWVPVILAGAASDLMAGRDLPTTVVEWVTGVLEREAMPVGTQQSLAVGLRRYRDYLIDGFASEMRTEYRNKVVRHNPFKRVGQV